MKLTITFYALVCILLLSSFNAKAQLPLADLCLTQKDPTTIQVSISPDISFNQLISEVRFTVKWKANTAADVAQPTFIVPNNLAIFPVKADVVHIVNGHKFQKYVGFGFSTLSSQGISPLSPGNQFIVANIGVVDANGDPLVITTENFHIATDPFVYTLAFNGDAYVELNSIERTGVICAPINPFPVEWLTFTAEKINEHDVELDWATATETNSDYFVLEKSKDNGSFEAIGQVKAAGNSQTVKNYTFLDQTGMSKSNVYRIKQFDLDGTHDYSQTVEVLFDFYDNDNFVIYPSPANSHAFLQTKSKLKGDVKFYISDLTGRILMQGVLPEQTPNGEVKIDLGDFAEGIYYVRSVTAGGKSYLNRLVKKAD